MSNIDISHPHALLPGHARQAVQEIAEKLTQRFGVDCEWNGDILNFVRSGVDGRIALLPGQVHVTAELGFLFGMMRDQIEAEIRRVLGERFG